jgi:hypothetical protein
MQGSRCGVAIGMRPRQQSGRLTSESVKGAALALKCVDHVHGGDGLAAGVLSVGNRVTDDVLKEQLQHTAGFFVNQSRNALDTTTASKAADSRLGDALDVVTQHLAVTLVCVECRETVTLCSLQAVLIA